MPLPILHSFTGYSVYSLSKKKNEDSNWGLILLAVLLANLADFDFLPGIDLGEAVRFHRGISHTFGAALVCGAVLALTGRIWKAPFLKTFLRSAAAYYSHIVLDFTVGAPEGLLLFWPFTGSRFYSTFTLFPTHHHVNFNQVTNLTEFLQVCFSPACLNALFFELTLVFSIWALVSAWRNFKEKAHIKEPAVLVRGGLAIFSWISFMLTRGIG